MFASTATVDSTSTNALMPETVKDIRASLCMVEAKAILEILNQAAELIGSMPETVLQQLKVRPVFRDELELGASLVREAIRDATYTAEKAAEDSADTQRDAELSYYGL